MSGFNKKWNFCHIFSKNIQILNFINIRQVRADLFHADGQTGRHELANSRFSKCYERTSKWSGGTRCHVLPNMPQPKCGFLHRIWWLISQLLHLHVRHSRFQISARKPENSILRSPVVSFITKIVSEVINVTCTPCSIPFLETFRHSNAIEPDVPIDR